MMGILAISEYIRHGKRNVFIVFQMAALLFVLCVSASTLLAEYRLYRPFAQLNHKEGLYLSASGYHGANPDAIAKGMEKVDYVFAIGTQNLLSKEAANGINVAVYPNQMIEDYQPDLAEGDWLSDEPLEKDCMPVVVSQNPYGWKKGSRISLDCGDEQGKPHTISIKVVGVLDEGAQILGHDFGQGNRLYYDYRDIFSTYRYEQEQTVLFLTSETGAKSVNMPVTYDREHFIVYKDGISRTEKNRNNMVLKDNLGELSQDSALDANLETFMASSNHEMIRKVMMYLPVLLSVLIITIVSLINVCTLNMADDLYHNAVFSLLGLPWKKCSCFSLVQSLFSAFLSVVLFFFFLAVTAKLHLENYVYVNFSVPVLVLLGGVILLLCAVHFIVPYQILRKKQPADVLRNRKE